MGLSIRAYARHRGVSHVAVHKALKAGRIVAEADGTIDPDKADAARERARDPARHAQQYWWDAITHAILMRHRVSMAAQDDCMDFRGMVHLAAVAMSEDDAPVTVRLAGHPDGWLLKSDGGERLERTSATGAPVTLR